MEAASPVVRRPSVSLDRAVLLLVGGIAIASAWVWTAPPSFANAQAVDVAINVAATLVGGAVAILAFVRWREAGQAVALYESAAFVALTLVNAVTVGVVLVGREAEFGLSLDDPGPGPVYLWGTGRLFAAALLVVGAYRGLRGTPPRLGPWPVLALPVLLLVAVAAVLLALGAAVPEVRGLRALAAGPPATIGIPWPEIVFAGVQIVVFGLFILAAVLFRRLWIRDGLVSHAFLTAGLVVAAFSQLHFAIDPIAAWGVVTSADVLRLLFHAILFLGIQAEMQADLGQLRRANGELRRLGEVEAANAMLAERGRLAREIHDGLAQHLWYAKLKQGRVAAEPDLPPGARQTVEEVAAAIDAALAEARQAVMAMRADPSAASTLGEVLRSYVEDFADRFGVRAEFVAEDELPRLAPRTEAEILRIVQEALNNVRKHADATVVRVRAECHDGFARVRIVDNGRGFEPSAVPPDRYGLSGMRERAELVGGSLEIRSRPRDGAEVAVTVPTDRVGEAAR